MHRISLAPVLSATRSRDSCWITSVSYVCQFSGNLTEAWRNDGCRAGRGDPADPVNSLGLFEDLHDTPPLGTRQRAGLHQGDPVAHAARVLLVVRLELAGAPQDL